MPNGLFLAFPKVAAVVFGSWKLGSRWSARRGLLFLALA